MNIHERKDVSPSGEVFIPTKLRGLPSKLVEEFLFHDALPVDAVKRDEVLVQRKEIVAETQRREMEREQGKRNAFNDAYAGLKGDDKALMDRTIALSGDWVGRFVSGEGGMSSLLSEESFLMAELREDFLQFQQQGAKGKFLPTLSDVDREILTNFQYGLALEEFRRIKETASTDLKEIRVVDPSAEERSKKVAEAILINYFDGKTTLSGILTEWEQRQLEEIKEKFKEVIASGDLSQTSFDAFDPRIRRLIMELPSLVLEGSSVALGRAKAERGTLGQPEKIERVQPTEQPVETKKVEAVDWRKVSRASEVMAVGDLFGSTEALGANLESLGVVSVDVNGNLHWVGGNRKIVFHGDILGDRQTHGMDAVDMISKLSKEAKLQGGEIDMLAGNHEDFFLSFLSGRVGAANSDAFESCRQGHYYGLLELCKYGSSQISNVDPDTFTTLGISQQELIWKQLNTERDLILKNMQKDSRGRTMLEIMCNFKLAVVHDDSLFTHTDPTFSMMKTLTQQGDVKMMADRINTYYQKGLRDSLLNDKEPSPFFDQLRDIFLNTDNREYFWSGLSGQDEFDFIDAIKRQGINAIFHGHTDQFLPVYERQGLSVASVDMGALRDEGHKSKRSVLKIKQNGVVERGKDFSSIRK